MHRWYPTLALVAAIGTYLLIVVGAVVRVTGSGLGCPDWPTCHGQLVPPADPAAVVEYTHRLLGAFVSPLILAVALGAWWARRSDWRVLGPATLAPGLLAVQIALGAVVVRLELPAMVVLVHLTFALLVLGLLVWIAVAAGAPPRAVAPPAANWRRAPLVGLVHATTLLLLLLLVVGGAVRATGASYACLGFPDCNGELLPLGSGRLVDLHLLHRLLAYTLAILAGGVVVEAWHSWRWLPAVPVTAAVLGALVGAQIAIGAVGVVMGLPPLARGLHVAGGAAVWACAVALAALLGRAPAPALAAGRTHTAAVDQAPASLGAQGAPRPERQGQGSAP